MIPVKPDLQSIYDAADVARLDLNELAAFGSAMLAANDDDT